MKAGRRTKKPPMTWSAAQYVKFEQERTGPVRDLVARIPNAEVLSAADIGCGPGNSTEVLRERYREARIVGLDSSPDMIEAARKRLPDVAFEVADIRRMAPEGAARRDPRQRGAAMDSGPRDALSGADRQTQSGRSARGANARQSRTSRRIV